MGIQQKYGQSVKVLYLFFITYITVLLKAFHHPFESRLLALILYISCDLNEFGSHYF